MKKIPPYPMRKIAFRTALVASIFLAGLLLGHFRAFGQADSADPIFGSWTMDLARSVNNRGGDHKLYATPSTRILTREGDGFRMSLANRPDAPPAVYTGKFDGKDYPDPRSPGQDKTLAHWRIAPNLIVRLAKTKGEPSEWVIYTVSSDGNVFTSTSWLPANPELEDLQVFTRAK